METTYIVMGIMETGEISRFCDTDFHSRDNAQEWIDDNRDNYPECGGSFYVEVIHPQITFPEWESDDDNPAFN